MYSKNPEPLTGVLFVILYYFILIFPAGIYLFKTAMGTTEQCVKSVRFEQVNADWINNSYDIMHLKIHFSS